MTKVDFENKYGPIKKLSWQSSDLYTPSEALDLCKIDNSALLCGDFYTAGYFPNSMAIQDITDWEGVVKAIDISKTLATLLSDVYESSDMDMPYFPIVLHLINKDSFRESFIKSVGLNSKFSPDILEITEILQEKKLNLFFPSDIIAEGIDNYFDDFSVASYSKAADFILDTMSDVQLVRLPYTYVTYPIFYIGHVSNGIWAGVFTVRTDS